MSWWLHSIERSPHHTVLAWSQWGQPTASDQRWSEVATHWGLRHGGPSETDVSSSVSKLSTLQTLSSTYIPHCITTWHWYIYPLDLPPPLISLLVALYISLVSNSKDQPNPLWGHLQTYLLQKKQQTKNKQIVSGHIYWFNWGVIIWAYWHVVTPIRLLR